MTGNCSTRRACLLISLSRTGRGIGLACWNGRTTICELTTGVLAKPKGYTP